MPHEIIWISNRRFYHFDDYNTKEEAIRAAKTLKKMYKTKTFIRTEYTGAIIPVQAYALYTNRPL